MTPINAFKRWLGFTNQVQTDPSGMELASKHWGEQAEASVRAHRPSSWAECPIVISEYINPCVSGSAERGWLEAVAADYFAEPVERALSLGCGSGGLERHGLQLGIAQHFDAYDVSSGAVDVAKEEAGQSGQANQVRYEVADLNRIELPDNHYGAVFASQSVHHIANLEHYMAQVCSTLIEGGLFIVNEFVGPNQFQWTDAQLQHAQRLLESIPEEFRSLIREEGIKSRIERPTIEAMNAYDPTEAIRSQEIVPQMEKHFEIIDRRDFGGTLLHLVLDNIAGNLSETDKGIEILRRLIVEEQQLLASGEIDSDFTVLIGRRS